MNPTLTPTEAPTWFSEAFEDAEREYCHFDVVHDGLPDPEWMSVWRTREEALLGEAAMGFTVLTQLFEIGNLDHFIAMAFSIGRKFVVLRDAQGNELKRWSVTA